MKKIKLILVALTLVLGLGTLAACSSSQPFSIVGQWKDSDGTIRVFSQDGTCQNVEKVDIGGAAATYSISSKADSSGNYTLQVEQDGMNQVTGTVKVTDNDDIVINIDGMTYNLTRQ